MKTFEKNEMLITATSLLNQITKVLDTEGIELNGELRYKLSISELNLYKIVKLLENDK
jgi:hypothetical protein